MFDHQQVSDHLRKHYFTPVTAPESVEAPGLIGIELERYTYVPTGEQRAPLRNYRVLFDGLCHAVSKSEIGIRKADRPNGKLFLANGDSLQFEPGGQLELAIGPANSLPELWHRLATLDDLVFGVGNRLGVQFAQVAMQPWFEPDELTLLLQTERYQRMIDYFDARSVYGRRMMLESSSLQIALDLGHRKTQIVQRIALANLLVPFATALFANSPNYGPRKTKLQSNRFQNWLQLDPHRTGVLSLPLRRKDLTLEHLIDQYAEFARLAPPIVPLDGADPTSLDRHLSTLFPDVRIRGFLEIRSIDVPPPGWEAAAVQFYCGLLYDDTSTDRALELLYPYAGQLPELLQYCVFGLENDPIRRLGQQLCTLACDGFERLPQSFRGSEAQRRGLAEYFDEYIARGNTFANHH